MITPAVCQAIAQLVPQIIESSVEIAIVLSPEGVELTRLVGEQQAVNINDAPNAGNYILHNHPPLWNPLSSEDVAAALAHGVKGIVAVTRTDDARVMAMAVLPKKQHVMSGHEFFIFQFQYHLVVPVSGTQERFHHAASTLRGLGSSHHFSIETWEVAQCTS